MSGILEALTTGELVNSDDTPEVAEAQGWMVARSMIHDRLPLWLVAAGLDVPDPLPPVDGFEDLDAVAALLAGVPVLLDTATPEERAMGLVLSQTTHVAPLRAVEVALSVVEYDAEDKARLCRVELEIERLLAQLATMAWIAHLASEDSEALFDLDPWQDATDALAEELSD